MALRAGYKGIKKFIADKLNSLSDVDSLATDTEVATQIQVQEQLLEDTVGWKGKNLLKNKATSQSSYGIDYTVNADGSVSVAANQTATGFSNLVLTESVVLPSGKYTLSGCPEGGGQSSYRLRVVKNGTFLNADIGNGYTFEANGVDSYIITLAIGTSGNTYTVSSALTFYPMLRHANIVDSAYEPYHASVADSLAKKCDNSVIGTVEDGATASQAYSVNDLFIRNGKIGIATATIAQGAEFTLGTNYTETTIGVLITGLLNA